MATETQIRGRRDAIADSLSRKRFMSMAELVEMLAVSESTVRRDLEVLEQQGRIRRTHGGAVFGAHTSAQSPSFDTRAGWAEVEKRAIAIEVVRLLRSASKVLLDGGTTCLAVGQALCDLGPVARELYDPNLIVVTHSIPTVAMLSRRADIRVTVVGGRVFARTGVTIGSETEEGMARHPCSHLVMSCAGLTREGVFNVDEEMVRVERRMIEAADTVVVAVDHTKLGEANEHRICGLDEVSVIVTDAGADDETKAWLRKLGPEVIFAEVGQ